MNPYVPLALSIMALLLAIASIVLAILSYRNGR